MAGARNKGTPLPVHVYLRGGIDHVGLPQGFHEDHPEFPQPVVIRPELSFQNRPRDELAEADGLIVEGLQENT